MHPKKKVEDNNHLLTKRIDNNIYIWSRQYTDSSTKLHNSQNWKQKSEVRQAKKPNTHEPFTSHP